MVGVQAQQLNSCLLHRLSVQLLRKCLLHIQYLMPVRKWLFAIALVAPESRSLKCSSMTINRRTDFELLWFHFLKPGGTQIPVFAEGHLSIHFASRNFRLRIFFGFWMIRIHLKDEGGVQLKQNLNLGGQLKSTYFYIFVDFLSLELTYTAVCNSPDE